MDTEGSAKGRLGFPFTEIINKPRVPRAGRLRGGVLFFSFCLSNTSGFLKRMLTGDRSPPLHRKGVCVWGWGGGGGVYSVLGPMKKKVAANV